MPAALHMLLSEEKYTYYILLILENQAGAVGRGWEQKGCDSSNSTTRFILASPFGTSTTASVSDLRSVEASPPPGIIRLISLSLLPTQEFSGIQFKHTLAVHKNIKVQYSS
jgi:hypothetical protein